MDTISRENNSMLPVGGIIVGVIALLIGGYAAIQLSKVNTTLKTQDEKLAKIESIETQINSAAAASDKNNKTINEVARQTQDGFNTLTNMLAELRGSVTKLEESQKKPVAVVTGKKGPVEAAVAGPGEYVVKPGDNSGAKIARDHGVALPDLMAVNPSVDWKKLKVGDKLKLPQKR
jgi:LysM repeat protein